MITFVTFHVDLNKQAEKKVLKIYGLYRKPSNYIEMLDMMFRSASIFHPDCKRVILTDRDTDFSTLKSKVEIFRTDIDMSKIMPSRLRAQIKYLKQHDFSKNLIFLDSDMIINSNIEDVFDQDFSVGLTFINKENMPINGGLIMVKKYAKAAALTFLERVDTFCREKYQDETWWSDQLALVDAVGVDQFKQRTSERVCTETDHVNVLLLSCDTYNFAPHPPDKISSIISGLKNRKVIHFRGARKRYMRLFWSAYVAPREPSRPDLVIKSYYTKVLLRLKAVSESGEAKRESILTKETSP